jgi:hypothetical protein
MRDVGEERAERDDELDTEVGRELRNEGRERPPADVRLDAEQQQRVAVGARNLGVVEGVVRPVDLPSDAFDERDVRPRGLEVEERLWVDVGEPRRLPGTREEAGCQ